MARRKVEAAQADPVVTLVPSLPDVVARTGIASPLLPLRMTNALLRAGVRKLGDICGWTFGDFLIDGAGTASIRETVHCIAVLQALPPGRLERLTSATPPVLPNLPIDVIAALSFATSVDDEITGLLANLPERNSALILARWGYGADGQRTLEEVGSAFGLTRERARQIVGAKESEIAASNLRLPLASEAVNDLDEAGGALPDDYYQVLLRHSQVKVSVSALRVLPRLSDLEVIPEVEFEEQTRLWVTGNRRARLDGAHGVQQLDVTARRRALRYLRRIGAVPVTVLEELSPFGLEHAITLLEGNGAAFEQVADHALRLPLRDSKLLRQCRKALVATGGLDVEDLLHGLRKSSLNVSRGLLEAVLDRCNDFVRDAEFVRLSDGFSRSGILAPAEARGFALLEQHGGVMSWWDFIEAMKSAGFSAPMAAVVLGKPAVKRLGPSTYGLRGREYDQSTIASLHARTRQLMGRRVIRTKEVTPAGEVFATYTLNRFALQGVLPVPGEIRRMSGPWTARFPDGRVLRVNVAKGFMCPFQAFMKRFRLKPGNELNVVFDPTARIVQIEIVGGPTSHSSAKSISREQQILRALFGNDN